ncbi:uncharacterized protein LOC128743680 [Sabethes cyaneus]|uniref:uncharacterized protein LOC128743680 n=1 Tax=Sabethes cyaneus TaxID=53552 RepID=UPI00237DB9AA|nr:uncharacterized protein LOC128743680 [Sabethes cyaneus]
MSVGKTSTRRSKKCYGYTDEDIKKAIAMVVREEYSLRQAAKACNIPRTSLAYYLKNATAVRKASKMRPEEEDFLLQWITDCCQRGFTIKKRNVLAAAEQLIQQSKESRMNPFVGGTYYEQFLERWLSTDKIKDRKFSGVVPDWYTHLDKYLSEGNFNHILNNPNRIFLCDEFKFKERMDVPESIKTALGDTNLLYTVTASGNVLQPLIVYPYKREIMDEVVRTAPKNCAIVPQQQGTVTPKILIAYLKRVLHEFIEKHHIPKPVIVYIDESQIDLTLELTTTCKNLNIILLGLTCQVMKPTVSLFRDVATGWTQEVQRWCQANAVRNFPIAECARTMQNVNQKYIVRTSIAKDFNDSLLFPWRHRSENGSVSQRTIGTMDELEDDEMEIEQFLQDVSEDEDEDEGTLSTSTVEATPSTEPKDTETAQQNLQKLETESDISESTIIRLRYDNFRGLLGKQLTEKCRKNYGSPNPIFSSRAERALFEIYRRFQSSQDQSASVRRNDVIEIVEIGDD